MLELARLNDGIDRFGLVIVSRSRYLSQCWSLVSDPIQLKYKF
jgi:hypothetical protein